MMKLPVLAIGLLIFIWVVAGQVAAQNENSNMLQRPSSLVIRTAHSGQDDSSRVRFLLSIAYSAFEAKDYPEARESFMNVLQMDSSQVDAIKGLAQVHEMSGAKAEALKWYRAAIERDSSDARILFRCGLTARELGQDSLAVTMFERCVRVRADLWEPWFELGLLNGRMDDLLQALNAFRKAHELNPDDWNILFFLGITASQLGDLEAAADWLSRAAEQNPQRADIWFRLGIAHYELRSSSDAKQALEKSVEMSPNHGPSYLWLAILANEADERQKARSLAEKAQPMLTDTSDKLNCYLVLADINLREGAPDSAIAALQTALVLDPDNLDAHELLSRAYLAKGDYKKAKDEYSIVEALKKKAANK